MIPNMPALGIRFDVDKVESVDYGMECWKVFWKAIDVGQIAGCLLFEGDTYASVYGMENVFCLAIQSFDKKILGDIRIAMEASVDYQTLAASPDFVEGSTVISEPLPEAGRVDVAGNLTGGYNARSALEALQRERNRE